MARPKGYAPYAPRAKTVALLGQVNEVLREYSAQLPLTARQIFYRLVGAYGFAKTEKAYKNDLCEKLVRARRAGMIPFEAIRDDGTMEQGGGGYSGPESFWATVRHSAEHYERDLMREQPRRIEVWCEAAGMLPQLARVAEPYSVPCYSGGGFDSLTVKKEVADRAAAFVGETIILHVGDYDPSGESIFESMTEDARAFVLADAPDPQTDLVPVRVALTEAQVDEHGLPTAPPKASDTRSKSWVGGTCQAEALPPDVLAATVRDAIEEWIDDAVMEESLDTEKLDRQTIVTKLDEMEES